MSGSRLVGRAFQIAFVACAVGAAAASAQTRTVEILNADHVEVESDSTGIVRRLRGNVRLRQDTTALTANRVVVYESSGLVDLVGGVRIISGHDTLTASEVSYDANTKVASATTRVRLGDGESVLWAPVVTYDSRAEIARFAGGGRILHQGAELTSPEGSYSTARRFAKLDGPLRLVDSTGVLTAVRGTYDARVRRADAVGGVHLHSPDARLDADSLVYFRRTERARAFGQVVLERIGSGNRPLRRGEALTDSTQRTFLFGEALVYDRQEQSARMRGVAVRAPLLLILRADSTGAVDSTLVRAPRLDVERRVVGSDSSTVLTAAGGAQVWERRLGAVADSARVERFQRSGDASEDRIGLFGAERPRAWAQGTQLTGDSLTAVSRNEQVELLRVLGRAFAARIDSVVGRVQQIQGDEIVVTVRDDDVERISVWPNAEAVYYRATPDSLLAGADRIKADSLVFRFADGELRNVSGIKGITGTSYGPANLPASLRLSGYAFDPEVRPTRQSVLDLDGWEAEWLRQFGPASAVSAVEARPSPASGGNGP